MSKQSQDQDEQQAPSGEAQGGADAGTTERQPEESGKTGSSSSSRRSRRRGKGGDEAATSATAQAGSASSDAVSGAGTTAKQSDGTEGAAATSPGDAEKAGETGTEKSAEKKDAGKSSAATASRSGGSKRSTGQGTSGSTGSKTNAGSGQSGGSGSGSGSGSGNDNGEKPARGGKAGALALVLVILLAIAVGVFGWLGWQRLQAQQQRLAEVPEQPATQGQVNDLSDQLQSGQSERESAVASLREAFEAYRGDVDANLDKVLQQLSRQQQTDEREWLHAEAAYLLRLANQRLQLERDVEGSAALLRTADARLKEADNPALMPVRREIASELAALRSVPDIDRTGLYLSLNALQEQIAGRPLAQDVEEVTGDASIEEAPSGGWQEQLSKVGGELKDLVTVRKHDEALEALISPEQESYLRQSVRLVLEQVQLALLKEEQELYDASLDKALTLIRGYYDTDDSGVQGVLSRLEELKGRHIRPELPDISGSQQALQAFIENRFESGGDGQGGEA